MLFLNYDSAGKISLLNSLKRTHFSGLKYKSFLVNGIRACNCYVDYE